MRYQISPAQILGLLTAVATIPATAAPNAVPPQKPSDQTLANKLLGSISFGSWGPFLPGTFIPMADRYTEQHAGSTNTDVGGPITDGLQLFIHPQKQVFSAEEPVMVNMQLRNGRKADLSFEEYGPPLRSVSVIIKNERGQDVPLTAFGKHLYGKQPFLLGHAVYVPSEMRATYHFWLNRAFDLSLPGTYAVTIRKTLDNNARSDKTSIVSNTASVTVQDPAFQSLFYSEAGLDQPPHKISPPAVGDFKLKF